MIALGTVLGAHAQLHTEAVEYKDGDTVLEGYLAYDNSTVKGKRPHVLHDKTAAGVSETTDYMRLRT